MVGQNRSISCALLTPPLIQPRWHRLPTHDEHSGGNDVLYLLRSTKVMRTAYGSGKSGENPKNKFGKNNVLCTARSKTPHPHGEHVQTVVCRYEQWGYESHIHLRRKIKPHLRLIHAAWYHRNWQPRVISSFFFNHMGNFPHNWMLEKWRISNTTLLLHSDGTITESQYNSTHSNDPVSFSLTHTFDHSDPLVWKTLKHIGNL